jgi:hypothetical protein
MPIKRSGAHFIHSSRTLYIQPKASVLGAFWPDIKGFTRPEPCSFRAAAGLGKANPYLPIMPLQLPPADKSLALCRAHVKLEEGNVVFRAALHDKSMPHKAIHSLGTKESDFSTLATIPTHDHEAIARYVEDLADRYLFSFDVYEPYKYLEPLAAYRLWSKRIEEATGIVLRQPCLSALCAHKIPRDFTGRLHQSSVKVKEGDIFNLQTACQLVADEIHIPVQIVTSSKSILQCDILRIHDKNKGVLIIRQFLFSRCGEPRSYAGKNQVIHVPTANAIKPFLALDSSECEWGDRIEMVLFADEMSIPDAISGIPDNCFAICCGDNAYLFGDYERHAINEFDPEYIVTHPFCPSVYLPTPFPGETTESILARFQKFLPEFVCRPVPYSQIQTALLGAALAAT